jgi:uncharacterized protein (TIGR02246 family)
MPKDIYRMRFTALATGWLAAVLAFSLVPAAFAQGREDAAVREVLTKYSAAVERADLEAIGKLWANDDSVIVIENGHANHGWADYRDHHLGPELKAMKNTKLNFTDIKVRLAGDTAWATFKYTISADLKERHVEGNSLATAVLEKRDDRWLIVHWHSSSPRRPPAANPAKPN